MMGRKVSVYLDDDTCAILNLERSLHNGEESLSGVIQRLIKEGYTIKMVRTIERKRDGLRREITLK